MLQPLNVLSELRGSELDTELDVSLSSAEYRGRITMILPLPPTHMRLQPVQS